MITSKNAFMPIRNLLVLVDIFIISSCVFVELPPAPHAEKPEYNSLLDAGDEAFVNPCLTIPDLFVNDSFKKLPVAVKNYYNPNHFPVSKNEYMEFCKKINRTFLVSDMTNAEAFLFFNTLADYSKLQRHFYHRQSILAFKEISLFDTLMIKKISEKHFRVFCVISHSSGNRTLVYEDIFFHPYSVSAELIEQWTEIYTFKKRHKKIEYNFQGYRKITM